MNNTSRTRFAALAVAVSAGLLLSACSDSEDPKPATNNAATQQESPSGSASKASVDGKELDAKFTTTCAKQGDLLALALTENGNATYGELAVSATLNGDDSVQAVGIAGSKGGSNGMPYAVGYGQGAPGGTAKVTKDGNTYTVTGEGVGAPDMSNPMAGASSSKFEITFACDTVVGG